MDDGVDDDGAPKVNATPPEVAGVSFGSETVVGLELGAGAGFPNVKGAGEDAGASEGALDPGSEVASALADPNSPVPDVLGAESIATPKANAAPVDVGASGFDELVSFREAAWMGKEVPNETSGFAVSLVTAGSVVAASDTGVDETPKVNGAAVAFRGDGVVDGAPNVKGAGAAAGFAAASAVEAGADVPKENGDGDVDAVRGDGAGSVAFFSSSSIASCTFFWCSRFCFMKLELQRLTFFGASSSAGLASAGLSASVALAGAPKVNGAAVEASLSSFDFSAPSDEDPFPKPNDGAAAGAVGGFVPNVNAGADDAAAPDSGADVPKENGDGDVDAVRGDGAGSVAFFSSSSIASCTFFWCSRFCFMKLELQRLTFFGASSSAGLASAGLAGLIASVAAGAGTDVAAPKVNVAGFVAAGAAAGEDELSPKVKFLSTFSLSCPATEPNFTTSIPPSSSSRKE
jgi:hypothetical protein